MQSAKKYITLIIFFLFLSTIIILLVSKNETRKFQTIEDSNGNKIVLQLLYRQGDLYSNVVNLYLKNKDDDFWRWYYVDHQSLSRSWVINLNDDGSKVMVKNRGKVIGVLDLNDRSFLLNGKIHSEGKHGVEFEVDYPYDQNYPVNKRRIEPNQG